MHRRDTKTPVCSRLPTRANLSSPHTPYRRFPTWARIGCCSFLNPVPPPQAPTHRPYFPRRPLPLNSQIHLILGGHDDRRHVLTGVTGDGQHYGAQKGLTQPRSEGGCGRTSSEPEGRGKVEGGGMCIMEGEGGEQF